MTKHNSKEHAAARKRLSRARGKSQFGQHRLEIVLSDRGFKKLLDACQRRNPGRKPYIHSEYIELLLFCDGERLERQEACLGHCNHCKLPLPAGCNTAFIGESACWFYRQSRSLNLTDVTSHAQLDEVQND
ncbi:hypothetical protein [Yersinia pseudotuberculosis]|uniref:Bacteriophage protein gp46 n=1 Tax=Yersinia pseudotuberculosis TaxID=633 RepID=A0ABN5R7Z8_YERPU|nr:hypothetical protein [Yersinia pseudotuberculosis]AYW91679.1 hypothetical protein EGX47_10365 [Yersinia pseudotuberculosis]KGA58093.1 hypothetical protein DJ55_2969 [Yersinia pseudotuberculosis]MBO1629611.1 hypothetical protein [Yersinia pseudotuberculosis]MBP0072089.1 hypothetical protein [Yersinia pseudotuberculosis]CND83540.1 bacteriophage protein gp46 [Yersinia pseudotuberculosis]